MNFDLIDDDTLDAIPDGDPGYAFVLFERACRKTLMTAIKEEEDGNVIGNLQLDYIHDIVAAAQHYGIPGLKDFQLPKNRRLHYEAFDDFGRQVRFFTTHFRLNAKAQRGLYSVELQGTHKDRIRTLLAHLKEAVYKADFPDARKGLLQKRIRELEKALDGHRLGFAEAMVCLSLIGAGLHGIGDGAEGLAKLVHEITVAIGQSKQIEDSNLQLLPKPAVAPPVYLIQARDDQRAVGPFARDEMEDEIPF